MTNISALRLHHEYEIDLTGKLPELSRGFTIEAWVRPAPMDRAARLYPQEKYAGQPVPLKAGLYKNIAKDHLPQLGSVDLPENIEVVIFSKPDFQGETLALRDDLSQVPDSHQTIGSLVVLDRSHRRQNYAVLFEKAGYQGRAEVLTLPDFWQPPEGDPDQGESANAQIGIKQVGSAWIPPGVTLEVTKWLTENLTMNSPTIIQVTNLNDPVPNEWPPELQLQTAKPVSVPQNITLLLFEKPNYEGRRAIISGKEQDLTKLGWDVRSAIYVNNQDGYDGIIGIGPKAENSNEREVRRFSVGRRPTDDSVLWQFWIPPKFLLVARDIFRKYDILQTGMQDYSSSTNYIIRRRHQPDRIKDFTKLPKGVTPVDPKEHPQMADHTHDFWYVSKDYPGYSRSPMDSIIRDQPTIKKDTRLELVRSDYKILHIPKGWAVFLFNKPYIEEVQEVNDYEILTDGTFDLSSLNLKKENWAEYYVRIPDGIEGVLDVYGWKVLPLNTKLRDNLRRELWVPPGFQLIRTDKQIWEPGFHQNIGVAWYEVAQIEHYTWQGDVDDFSKLSPPDWTRGIPRITRRIETRRAKPLGSDEDKSDSTVASWVGILSNAKGTGLTLERTRGELRGGPDELRFGGQLLRPDRWVHLALTWDRHTLCHILNGRKVKEAKVSKSDFDFYRHLKFALNFRGSLTQLLLWTSARLPEEIAAQRFPPATPLTKDEIPYLMIIDDRYPPFTLPEEKRSQKIRFKIDINSYSSPPDAVVVSADLPDAPADSVLVRHIQQQVEVENAQKIRDAHQQATPQKILAHKRAQRTVALATEQARRVVHLEGMKWCAFVRGDEVICRAPKTEPESETGRDGSLWSALEGGFNYYLDALAIDVAGNLYAGVAFTQAGGVTANSIAKWDGSSWSALGDLVATLITALAIDVAGNLYAGGEFTKRGEETGSYIAKWDGSSWSAIVGGGVNNTVHALAFDVAGNLYAGGEFTKAGEETVSYIAKWDGSSWSAVGGGVDDVVNALAVDVAGNLYAGGEFTQAGGGAASHIAKWDGSSWSAVGGGVDDVVNALAVDVAGNLYAGGKFTQAGGVTTNSIAKWDGSSWSPLGDLVAAWITELAIDVAGNLYVGAFITQADKVTTNSIAKWDGSSWSVLENSVDNPVDTWIGALAVDVEGNLYVKEEFAKPGEETVHRIAKWVSTPHDTGNLRITDLAMDAQGRRYVSLDGASRHIRNLETNQAVSADLPNPPQALAIDFSGTHPIANQKAGQDGKVWTGLYWIEADGAVCRSWVLPEKVSARERQQLFGIRAPLGRSSYWDLALDTERQILYWANGWELYKSSVKDNKPVRFEIVVPHVRSPFPVAVAVAPDGSLLWLDAEDEMVRMLPFDSQTSKFGALKELYPAPRPANGLVVSRLAGDRKPGEEAPFVYWVAAERRTLEVPLLDTPGRYIDLYYDPKHPRWHGQHVDMVAVSEFAGAQWMDAPLAMTSEQAPGQGDAANSKVLSFGAGQNSDQSAGSQDDHLPGPDDVLAFEPIRIDLHQGWTVSAELVWEGPGSDPQTPICLYELATFEDEERIVCLIEPGEAETGIPTLHLRWNGDVLTGEHKVLSNHRLRINERQRVTWTLDRRGLVSTFIDGEQVVEEQISLPHGVRVFEAHCLGAPNSAQTHQIIEGVMVMRDDPKRVFTGFHGRIVRFGVWNCAVPKAAQGWESLPGPDPTWARSLVTVESKHRYLHAGRLDGKEPSVILFPIEMDGGLNIESVLDQTHAELTLAHAQKVADEEYAAHLKAVALQDAQAKLDAATQNLVATQAKAKADVDAAQAQADRDKAAARQKKADADAQAERDRVKGKQDADRTKTDGGQQAQAMENRAADDKRQRIGNANQRRSAAQTRLDNARR